MKRTTMLMLGLAGAAVTLLSGCQKDLSTGSTVPQYTFASLDTSGGTWKTIVLTSATQIAVPAPDSAAYAAEVAATKSAASNLSADQRSAISFWGGNPQIRWMELAEELAAKYNLPPAPDAAPDSTGNYYGVPSSANPTAYPNFPFAHPPYSSRMYAYWSAAMYDAMIATWHYKFAYHRKAPYLVDNTVPTQLPQTTLPSYPSEDAVVAAVSDVILRAMFPLDSAMIDAKYAEAKQVRVWAGMNVKSDIDAGDALGRAVAALFIARSKTDGMKNAQPARLLGTHVQDSIDNAAQAKYGWHWENLESPRRPVGIAPLYGKSKPWWIADISTIRPGPPPAPGSAAYNAAVQELHAIQDNTTTAQRDIAFKWGDGPSTYAPQGHWNRIASQEIVNHQLNPLRTARVFAYINTAMHDACISCWDTKYYYDYPRPSGTDPTINVLVGIPNFPSYPSGHSSFSWAGATVLSHFFPSDAGTFAAQAGEAADSRIYGRIHFRFDCDAGQQIGQSAGAAAVAIANGDHAE